jgi:hypothetical protein
MKTKSITKLVCGLAAGLLISGTATAQFSFSGQYMSRGEYRHGYSTLSDTNMKAGAFISQRTRLNGEFKQEKYRLYVSVQDVRTWGSVGHSVIDNTGALSLFEGYGELFFTKKIKAKVGRQVLSYDDDRILGGLDWAMQARRHDAGVFSYTDSTMQIHLGAAYNQNAEANKNIPYTVTNGAANNYASFQYLWVNKQIKKTNVSFLFLNNGMPFTHLNGVTGVKNNVILYTQTMGLRAEYKGDKLQGLVYGYYQMGDDATPSSTATPNEVKYLKTSAYNACAEVGYKPMKGLLVTLGGEILSGQSQTDTTGNGKNADGTRRKDGYINTNHAFNPFYGTNHRFNGYMDYFYVGNHVNSVGLMDIYLRVHYTYKKVIMGVNGHYFNAAAPIRDTRDMTVIKALDANLGGEVDATLSYNYSEGVAIQAGYSQFFGSYGLKQIRGAVSLQPKSNWAYLSLIIRPGKIAWPKCGLKM